MEPAVRAIDDALKSLKFDEGTEGCYPRRLQKAETVLQRRTSRVLLVLEASSDSFNHVAVFRTAECFGIQNVWVVEPAFYRNQKTTDTRKISRESLDWITIRRFPTSVECIKALREDNRKIWVTDLSQVAVSLESEELCLPERMALVIGRESDGASEEMLQAADRRVYLPIHGFADSLNLNVAAATVLQSLFWMCPEARGAMNDEERHELREQWYKKLAKDEKEFQQYIANPPPPFVDLRRPEAHRAMWVPKKIKKRVEDRELELKQQNE